MSNGSQDASDSQDDRSDRLRQAAAHLATIEAVISGQDQTRHVAGVLIKGFDLTTEEAHPLLGEWNKACHPPWNDGALAWILASTDHQADNRPRGYLYDPDLRQPANGPVESGADAASAGPDQPSNGKPDPAGMVPPEGAPLVWVIPDYDSGDRKAVMSRADIREGHLIGKAQDADAVVVRIGEREETVFYWNVFRENQSLDGSLEIVQVGDDQYEISLAPGVNGQATDAGSPGSPPVWVLKDPAGDIQRRVFRSTDFHQGYLIGDGPEADTVFVEVGDQEVIVPTRDVFLHNRQSLDVSLTLDGSLKIVRMDDDCFGISPVSPPAPSSARRAGAPRGKRRGGDKLDEELADVPRTDVGNGERLVARFGDLIRHCHLWGKWLAWDTRRWAIDAGDQMASLAKRTARRILAEASCIGNKKSRKAHISWNKQSECGARIELMLRRAAAEEGIPVLPGDLDQDPWLLNCLNGTIDLKTGKLRPHRRADLITKLAPVEFDSQATCPHWDQTLELFLPDAAVRAYLQRLCGYALTGVIKDHIMPVAYGTGANGKSTILGAVLGVMGTDYAMKAPPDLLMTKHSETHPTEPADLLGKRLVVAIETEDGRRLNETMVKELTGGDRIRARRMREDFWEFEPTHKIIMATNHKPIVRGTDLGIWRRLVLVPFTVRVEGAQAIKDMPEKLKAEYSGILAWMVRGCLDWQKNGLGAPEAVASATRTYRDEQDLMGDFLADECVIDPEAKPPLSVGASCTPATGLSRKDRGSGPKHSEPSGRP
jgi:P4 family phage/plasmid primase-like protien